MAVRKHSAKPGRTPRATPGNDSQLVVRLPGTLVGRVDQYAARMRQELPGVRFARAEAVRVLLTRALDQLATAKGKP
ncbi:MAG: hypothetical protein K0R38_5981 [Polyangiaceae bacterium]|jgi:hypothetical protein|nr:hypothetical protein [Polyangiaceae bacterium]